MAPSPNEPSRSAIGTAVIASSESDEMNGTIMIPITRPAASALSEATERPIAVPRSRTTGATTSAAKKPYTTVGTPARISSSGLITSRARAEA